MTVSDHSLPEKLTIRLPAELLDELRAAAEATGASLNAVAVQAMTIGSPKVTESAAPEVVLSSRVTRPASKKYNAKAIARRVGSLKLKQGSLAHDLNWVRGDR